MTRLRGWAPKGERLIDKVPQGRWKTATFLAALRRDRIDAPCLFDGPINGERLQALIQNQGGPPAYRQGTAVQAYLPADGLRVLRSVPLPETEDPPLAVSEVPATQPVGATIHPKD